ncbi:MAG: hypothetical protein H0X15_16240 [Acidobacteria bacterium]|nr:hypothetical protein [Acidobacteriota bacterium]
MMKTHGIERQLSRCREGSAGVRRDGMDALQHNNSFNRSGVSLNVIENLSHDAVVSRPVNSGVMSLSPYRRIQIKL